MVDVSFSRDGLKLVGCSERKERDRQAFMLAMALIIDVWRYEIRDSLDLRIGFFTEDYKAHFIANLEELGVWQACGSCVPMTDTIRVRIGIDDVPLLRPQVKS